MKKVLIMLLALSTVTAVATGCKKHKEHEFSSAWTSDATSHWHACTGCDEKKDIAPHNYVPKVNGDKCVEECVCGAKNENVSVSSLVNSVVNNGGLVKAGSSTYVSGTEGVYNSDEYVEKYDYEYRNGYLYVKNNYMDSEDYYALKNDGGAYSVRVTKDDSGNEVVQQNPEEYSVESVKGIRFNSIILNGDMSFFGAEDLIFKLYDEAATNSNGDFKESVSVIGGKVNGSFSFGYHLAADGYFFRLSVDFTLSAQGYLESATVLSNQYTHNQFKVVDDMAVPKMESEMMPEGGEGGEEGDVENAPRAMAASDVEDKEVTAFYNYKITVQQTSECANANIENPYDPNKVLVSSVDIQFEDGTNVPDVLTVEAMEKNLFYIKNLAPETAMPALNPVSYTIDGEVADFFDERLMLFYNKTAGTFNVNAQMLPGTYELQINFGEMSKTITIEVVPATPTSLTPSVFDGTTYTRTKTTTTYAGMNLSFKAAADADYYDSSCTATLTGENAADASIVWDEEAGEYVFSSAKVGTYTVELVSKKAENVKTTLTVTVKELPNVAEILSGSYEYKMKLGAEEVVVYTAQFKPDVTSGEMLSGSVEVTWVNQGTIVYFYTYTAAEGLVISVIGGVESLDLLIGMNANFSLYVERAGAQYPLTGGSGIIVDDNETAGHPLYQYMKTFSGTYRNDVKLASGQVLQNAIVQFLPDSYTNTQLKGTIEFTDPNSNYKNTASYVFTEADGFVINMGDEGKWITDRGEYVIEMNSDNQIVVTMKNLATGNSTEFVCEQEISEPDAYIHGSSQGGGGSDSGLVGDKLNGEGTMLNPYKLFDEATVVLNLNSNTAHAVFQFTATANGNVTFGNANNAEVLLGESVAGVISPVGEPLDVYELEYVSVTAGETYYFIVYREGDTAEVSFDFWVING